MKNQYLLKFLRKLPLLALIFACISVPVFGQGVWMQKTDFGGTKRSKAVGFSILSKGYIGLGKTGSSNYKDDFWEYNPVSDSWAQAAVFPGNTRSNAVSFTIGSSAYVGTGAASNGTPTNELYQYNQLTNSWNKKADLPYSADSATGFAIDNKGYIGIGSGAAGAVDDFYKYDPVTDSWSAIKKFPFNALGAFGFAINNKGYVCTIDSSNNFWEYSPVEDTWNKMANFPGETNSNNTVFVLNNKAYAATSTNEFWQYDPVSNSWSQMSDFDGAARRSAVGFSIGSTGYIGTGISSSSTYKNDFWAFARKDTFNADFSLTNSCFGIPVIFVDNSTSTDSTNIVSWEWNFGDGNSSINQFPNYDYPVFGNYMVKLIITDNLQNKDTIEKPIAIHEKPATEFTFSFIDSLKVSFVNNTVGAGEYYWQFGDGSISTSVNVLHSYATKGIYEVCLSGYNFNGCEGKICKLVDLNTVGMETIKNKEYAFNIYPNPATDHIFLSGEVKGNEKTKIQLIDALGKIMFSKNIENAENFIEPIDIKNLNAGFYLIQIQTGDQFTRKKLIVK